MEETVVEKIFHHQSKSLSRFYLCVLPNVLLDSMFKVSYSSSYHITEYLSDRL